MKKYLCVKGAEGGGDVERERREIVFGGGAVADRANACRTGIGLSVAGFILLLFTWFCSKKIGSPHFTRVLLLCHFVFTPDTQMGFLRIFFSQKNWKYFPVTFLRHVEVVKTRKKRNPKNKLGCNLHTFCIIFCCCFCCLEEEKSFVVPSLFCQTFFWSCFSKIGLAVLRTRMATGLCFQS